MKRKPSAKALKAWRDARVESYCSGMRSMRSLASMLVDLEDSTGSAPEFDIDEEWPSSVQHWKVRR